MLRTDLNYNCPDEDEKDNDNGAIDPEHDNLG